MLFALFLAAVLLPRRVSASTVPVFPEMLAIPDTEELTVPGPVEPAVSEPEEPSVPGPAEPAVPGPAEPAAPDSEMPAIPDAADGGFLETESVTSKASVHVIMHRLYNPNSGEHFYTASDAERSALMQAGWDLEGIGWIAPKISKTPVYRLYNPNAGDHHYTTSRGERNTLVAAGWNDEGIGWYSDDGKAVPVYREYDPNAVCGAHNFTTSVGEHNALGKAGWKKEGVAWYGVRPDKNENCWIMTEYTDESGFQGMFYTIRNEGTGELVVIDGGWPENAEKVRREIRRNGGEVTAWIITHFHNDHVCALNEILKDPRDITIRRIITTPLDRDVLEEVWKPWDMPEVYDEFLALTAGDKRVVYPKRGSAMKLAGMTFTFFNTYDSVTLDKGSSDIPNNCSLVFRVDAGKSRVLFCADCLGRKMSDYLVDTYGDALRADYVQAAHHGNTSLTTRFYSAVSPRIALFDAPGWLMESSDYTAGEMKAWFEEQGVRVYDLRTGDHEFTLR